MRSGRSVIARSIASIFSSKSAHHSPPPPPRQRFAFESLESRLLLSADPAAAGSLVVVDGAIGDQAGRFSGAEVLILDQNRDGLEQITQALAARSGSVSALHIVSHGASGSLALGATTLDAASLEGYQAQLRAWADALTADADILFYGCNVAADEAGIGFIEELSRLSGADIAASTDLTGSADLGGDWELEYATGSIEAEAIASSASDLILATVNYNAATDTLTFTADAAQVDAVTITSPVANQLRIAVNADTLVLTGDTAAGFTLNAANNQLDIDTSAALISVFDLLLEDQNDTVNFTNNLANGLGAVSIVGGAGNETVTLNATTLAGNLSLGVETVTVAAGANVNVGTNAITATGSNVTFGGASTVTAATFTAGTLNISAGTVNLNADTTATTLNLSGSGVLSGSGDVTLSGTSSTWTTGTYTGTGQLIVSSGATLTLSGSLQRAFGTGTLVNEGTVLWTGGNIDVIGNGTVVNRGLFDVQGNGAFGDQGTGVGTITFNNELGATLRKSVGTGLTAFGSSGAVGGTPNGVNLTNVGTIDVQTGTLSINHSFAGLPTGTSTGSGIFAVAAGAALQFGATNTLTASSVVTGAGTVSVQHGSFSTLGTWSHTGTLAVNGGNATFTPNTSVVAFAPGSITVAGGAGTFNSGATTGALTVSSGTATFNAPVSATTLALSGGTLTGAASVTLSGASSSWTGGTYTGTGQLVVSSGHTLTIGGATQKTFGTGTLVNDGTVLWTGGNIDVVGNGTVVNRGLFDAQVGNGAFGDQGTGVGTLAFNNEVGATLRKSVAGGLTALGSSGGGTPNGVNLTNAGAVDVQTGTLSINHSFSGVPTGNSTASGTFAVAASASLQFGATNTLTASSTVSGAGAVSVQHGVFSTVGTWGNTGALTVNGGSATFTPVGTFAPGSITVAGGTGTFNSAVSTGPLTISTGTATFNAPATTTSLSQTSGTLAGSGNVTVSGATTLSGGSMTGSGDTITLGALTINVNGANLDAGRLLDVRGGATWSAGSINLNSNSVPGSGTIINRAGSVFENSFNGSMFTQPFGAADNGADARFTNEGTFRKSGGVGPGATTINTVFDNGGAIEVQSGTLNLIQGGTHTGSFSGTGTLQFGGGTHELSATTSVTTTNATFSAGTANVGGTYNITGTTLVSGGTVNFTGTLASLGNTLNITTGTANVGGADATVTTFTQSGGTLSGTGDLTVSGATTLSGGSMSGSGDTITLGALTINVNGIGLDAGRLLDVRAGATWSAGGINLNANSVVGSGTIINRVGSVFDNTFNGSMFTQNFGGADTGATALFTNLGTFRKTGGAGNTTVSSAFDNQGVVEVQAGTLNISGGGTHTGSFSGTGTLQFGGGTHELSATTSVTTTNVNFTIGTANVGGTYDVAGTTLVNGGTANFTGTLASLGNTLNITTGTANVGGADATVTTFTQSGGTLSGTGDLTVSGATTLSGGSMTGSGDTITLGALTINVNGANLDAGRLLDVRGGATWSAGSINLNSNSVPGSGTIINRAGSVFENSFNGSMFTQPFGAADNGADARFTNEGTFRKSGGVGPGATTINTVFDNGGAIEAQSGTLNLIQGGTHTGSFSGTGTLQFGGGTHELSATTSVTTTNATFSAGTANVGGTYNITGTTLVSGGTVNFTGTLASLGNTLNITTGTANVGGADATVTTFTQSGGTLSGTGDLTVSGATTLSGGSMTGSGDTITLGALTINVNGANLDAGRLLDVRGGATWSAGSINLNSNSVPGSGTIINRAGSVFENSFNGSMFTQPLGAADNGADARFTNEGTFRKSGGVGPGATTINTVFDNGGAIEVQSGTLNLIQGGTHTGSFSGTGTLQFGGGTHELSATTSVTTTNATFSAGTANVGGTYNITGTTLVSGGTVNFTGTLASLGNTLNITTGTANVGGADATVTTFTQSGGTLSGTGDLTVSGATTLSGGTMTGWGDTITLGALTINVNGTNLDAGRLLDVHGGATWSAGNINLNSNSVPGSGTIINRAGSVFENSFNGSMFTQPLGAADNGADARFTNAGTFRKSGGAPTGQTSIGNVFDNSGTVQVQTGVLNVTGTLVQTGTVDVANGATYRKIGGFTNSGTLAGNGTFDAGVGSTLTNAGVIAPGTSPGLLTFNGHLLLTDTSEIDFELAGLTRGTQYDAINVTGTATLDGDANIFHLGGFVPTEDDAFVVIQAASVIGTFDNVIPPDGFEYTTVYGADHVTFHLAENEEPVAVNDSFLTAEDTPLVIAGPGLLANDTDPDLDPLTALLGTGPAHGTLIFADDGSFTYTPDLNFFGTDSFTYRAFDGRLPSDLATVSLTITPVNDTPVANNDSVTTNEDFAVTIAVRSNDTDVDFDALTVSQFTQGANGTVVLRANGNLIYTPNANFFGTDTFTYRVRDAGPLESNEATVSVTVAPVADFSLAFLTPTGSVGEGAGAATLTVVLTTDTALNSNVTVDLTAPGTGSAILGADYTFTNPTTLTFLAGSVTGAAQSADVAITNERSVETVVETADFNFGNISVAGLGVNAGPATGSHTLSITDNDSAAVAIAAPGTTSVAEGGGSVNVGVILTLTTDGTGTEQLDVEVLANLPGNGDYATTAALFGVGATNGATADVVVTAVNDRNVEQATESFAGQALSVTSTATASASTSQAIDVVDNDSAAVVITTPGTTSVTESGASANVGVTLMLTTDGTVGTAQLDVAVAANLPGNADYSATGVVFGVGAISGDTADVVVAAVNDRSVEQATESFAGQVLSVTSTADTSTSTSQTIDVIDNDSASVAIASPGVTSVTEGGASANVGVTLTLTTDGVGSEQLDVQVAATLPGNADYAATAAVFGVGSVSGATADVVVSAVNDRRVEQASEIFTGQALSVTSTASASASTSQAIQVTDNDSASVAISSPGTTSVTEGGASADVGVTLTLIADGAGTEQLDVQVAASLPGNADYVATGVVFGVGSISGDTANVVVTAVNDRRVEQANASLAGQALSVASTAAASASTSQTINVVDNDSASVAITAPDTSSVIEGGASANVGVTLTLITDGAGTEELDVEVAATLPGNGEYTATAAVFGVGSISGGTADVVVTAVNDRNVEQSTESFAGQALSVTSTASTSTSTSQTINVTDNDSASVAITAPGTTSVTEGGAAANVGVTLTLTTDGVGTEQLDVDLVASLPGNADYAATAAVFGVGAISGDAADMVVTAVNDRRVEQVTESFTGQALSVTSTASASASTSQTIDVVDNDSASVAITSPGTTSVIEGRTSASVGVTLTLTTGGTVGTEQLDVAVAANLPGNGDYAATGVVFGVGAISGATAGVVVTAVNDRNVEQATESFAGQALSVTSTASASASTSQTINVMDNDSAAVVITTPGTTSVTEGGSANVGVTLTLTTDGTVGTAQLDVAVAATLPGNADYAATDVVFGVGAISGDAADVVITAVNDRNVEQVTEVFAGQALSVTSTANASASTSQTVQVTDNDSASVAISAPGTTSVTEGGASANVGVTLLLTTDGVGTEQLDVAVAATLPGNGDYAATDALFGVGAVSGATADVVVSAANDVMVEQAVESFAGQVLSVASTANVSASTSQTIEVVDNDTAVYTINDVTVSEADGTLTFTVSLSNPVDIEVAIDVSYADQTAAGAAGGVGADYDNDRDQVVFAALDMSDKQVTVAITDDSIAETAETFLASLSAATALGGRSIDVSDTGIGTIANDDANNAPVAVDDTFTTNEDTQLLVSAPGVLGNDTDADLDALTAQLVTGPAHGTLVFGSDGGFVYTPDLNFFGSDSFTYRVSDEVLSDEGLVTITVNAVNDAPDAQDDTYTTDEDVALTIAMPGLLANDTDVDSALTAILETGPANGTLVLNADGSFTYTPNLNFNGTDSFTYRASDGPLSDLATVLLTVNAVNDAPDAADDSYMTDEDVVLTIAAPGVLANDADVDSTLTAILETGPANGTLVFSADGSFTYTPNLNFNGTDSFTYRASDGPESDLATVLLTVNAVNDAPVAVDDVFATDEDVALTIAMPGLLANDTDVDSALTAILETGPANGTLVLNADGSFTYTPNLNFNGTDSFSYKANDGDLDSDIATVTLTVNAVNDAPVANPDSFSVDEDNALTVSAPGILGNDTDVEASMLTSILVSTTTNGVVTLNPDGSFTYTPNLNFNGTDSFTYKANDGDVDSDITTVTLTVNAVNDAPDAQDDNYTALEDVVLVVNAPGVLGNDSDVDSVLSAAVVDDVDHGTLSLAADGSFLYVADLNFFGTDTFTYEVSDGQGGSDIATVTLTVNAVNDAPVAVNDAYATDEDTVLTVAMPGVLANDTDVDSTLSAILEAGPAHGTLVFNADGSFTYTPNLNFNGTDSFTYRASDGPESDLATVLLTVNAVNDAPDAQDDTYTALEDVVLMVNAPGVLGNDSDVDSVLSAAVVDDVDHGTLSLAADGSFLYVADLNFFGTDTFIYEVSDGQGGTDTATVTITVEAVNDPVLAVDDAAATAEDTALSVPVVANDEDADGDVLFVTDVGLAANGTVTFSGGAVIYTPNANFHGTDTFEYTVSDGEDIDTGLVTVTVTPVNDAPVAVDDMATTDEDLAVTIAVLSNDTDVDLDTLTVAGVTQGANGSVAINPGGTVSYTPNAGFSGSDSFTYTVSDGQGGTDTGLVTVTVDQADDNDAPVFVEVADRTITEGQEVRFTIVATDADDPAGALVYSVTSGLPAGATFNAATREFVWVPADEEGAEVTTLSFTVLDPDGATDTMDVVLTVTNAKPTVDAGANQVVGLQKVDDDHGHDHGYKKGEAEVSIKATFNDLGTRDTHTATIDWGDGKVTSGSVSESPFGPPGSTAGANGSVTGSHTYKKAGVYTVKVTVKDDDGAYRTDTLTVTVKDPDKHLRARGDEYKLREDGVLQVNAANGVLRNDRAPGSLPLTARLVEGPDHGALVFNADGSFTYRPDANFHGEDSFWYEFTDGSNVSKAVRVELDVKSDGRHEACIDWGGHGGWHGGHFGGGQHANFVEFLIKLARKFD